MCGAGGALRPCIWGTNTIFNLKKRYLTECCDGHTKPNCRVASLLNKTFHIIIFLVAYQWKRDIYEFPTEIYKTLHINISGWAKKCPFLV